MEESLGLDVIRGLPLNFRALTYEELTWHVWGHARRLAMFDRLRFKFQSYKAKIGKAITHV